VASPDRAAASSLDVSIADAAKVVDVLHSAERAGTALPAGAKPVWVTELNWESAPESPHGVPPSLQASWLSRALHRLWVAGVSMVAWQFLTDPYPAVELATATGGLTEYPRPAGLFTAGVEGNPETAQPKQFLRAFELPFDPLRVSRRQVRVWALLDRAAQPAEVQRMGPGGVWQRIAVVRADAGGVVNGLLRLRGTARLRLLSGGLASASAVVGARVLTEPGEPGVPRS
jgi:hypothetical protein